MKNLFFKATDGTTYVVPESILNFTQPADGKDGNGIASAVLNADYTLTLTFTDGTKYTTPSLRGAPGVDGNNGKDGHTPVKGVDYFDGLPGKDGEDGYTPVKGVDYFDGEDGYTPIKGKDYFDGKDGKDGVDGYTPVKEVDYFTAVDQESLIQQILTVMGMHIVGVVDANNNIVLTGKLTDGLYTLKYEDAEGKTTVIGTIDTRPGYTNMLLLAVDENGDPYNGGQGWKANTRLSSSGAESTSSATGMECTGFIPFKKGDVIRFRNITMNKNSANTTRCYFNQYDENKAMLKTQIVSAFYTAIKNGEVLVDDEDNIIQIDTGDMGDENSSAEYPIYTNAAYFRISADEINADSIITINQEID